MMIQPEHLPKCWVEEAQKAITLAPKGLSARGWAPEGRDGQGLDAASWLGLEVVEVATALAFLRCGPVTILKRVGPHSPSSYGLKHQAERWGAVIGFCPYVSNGAMIAAAIYAGVPIRSLRAIEIRSLNCRIAVRVQDRGYRR